MTMPLKAGTESLTRTGDSDKPVIVLDAGKVLVDFDVGILFDELSVRAGEKITASSLSGFRELMVQVYKGKSTPDELRPAVNRAFHLDIGQKEWAELWCCYFTGEIPGMREALTDLKQNFQLIALSNTDALHWTYLVETFPIFTLLDGWALSYEEGMAKPEPGLYRELEERFCSGNVPAFYTDDFEDFVRAARSLGWTAEVFRGAEPFREQIRHLM